MSHRSHSAVLAKEEAEDKGGKEVQTSEEFEAVVEWCGWWWCR